jgi:hypothetical protein
LWRGAQSVSDDGRRRRSPEEDEEAARRTRERRPEAGGRRSARARTRSVEAGTRRTRSRGRRPEAGGRAGEDDEDGEVREKNELRLIRDYKPTSTSTNTSRTTGPRLISHCPHLIGPRVRLIGDCMIKR